jgi:hypothetical protein
MGDLTEQELRDLAYRHRGEVVEGSGVAVEPRRLDATTPAALDIDRIRAAVEASKPPGWARGESAWRRDTVALLAEVERLRAYVDHLHEVHGDQLDQVAGQRDVAVRELAAYRPPLSGRHPYPTYDQIVKAWQDALDQQDEWHRAAREESAEVERLRARVAELEEALTRAENEVEAVKP